MKGVRPCPYCGGEVEVIKLEMYPEEKKAKQLYRIQCYVCHATVARGRKFPIESSYYGKKRIKEYDNYIREMYGPRQSAEVKESNE